MRVLLLAMLLLITGNQAVAWWNTPYGYAPGWPNAWPAYRAPMANVTPYNFNGSDWNMRGTMSQSGDAHFIFEYRGNIYDDFYGQGYNRPYSYGFPGYPSYGRGWRR